MYSFKITYGLIFKNQKKAKEKKLKGEQKIDETGRKQRVNTIISIITLTKRSNHPS